MYISERADIEVSEVNTMDDAEIVQLYWDRNEQALAATADKYG